MAGLPAHVQIGCFLLLIFQTAFTVLMIRYSRLRDADSDSNYVVNPLTNEREIAPLYATSASVALSEFGKMWVGIIYVIYDLWTSRSSANKSFHAQVSYFSRLQSVLDEFSNIIFGHFGTFVLMAVPSISYAIQNNLLITALHHLDSSVYQVTYQCKTFSAAIFAISFLGRTYSWKHYLSFGLLAFGAAMASLSVQDDSSNTKHVNNSSQDVDDRSFSKGILCIIVACCISGGAGTFMEAMLKDASSTLASRNIQLGLFGCLTSLILSFFNDDFWNIIYPYGFLHGFNVYTWIVVISNIAGGYLVAIVLKYLSNIVKAFSGGTAVLLVCIGSYCLFGTGLSIKFAIGAVSVISGNIIYGLENLRHKASTSSRNTGRRSPEKQHLIGITGAADKGSHQR